MKRIRDGWALLVVSRVVLAFPHGSAGKESACSVGDLDLIPGLGRSTGDMGLIPGLKIPWRRAWQPTPVWLPGDSSWTEEPGGLQSIASQRVRHN